MDRVQSAMPVQQDVTATQQGSRAAQRARNILPLAQRELCSVESVTAYRATMTLTVLLMITRCRVLPAHLEHTKDPPALLAVVST
jgi:hypothetical protein